MKAIPTTTKLSLLVTLSVCIPWTHAQESGPEPSQGRWSISAGPLFRDFEGGNFESGSRSQSVSLPKGSVYDVLSTGTAGPETGEVLRTYSDGFVGPDVGGTTPGSLFENTTSRFGYENNSQNNADTTLVFQSPLTGEQGLSSSQSTESNLTWSDDADSETGALVELAYQITAPERKVDLLAQFSFLYSPFEIQGSGSTFEATRRDTRKEITGTLTDTYQVPTGVILPLAPYSQASANPPPGFYPRIADEPSRVLAPVSRTVGTDTIRWYNRIEEEVEADVFTFTLGPKVRVRIADAGFLSASAGAALHVVDWQASHSETLYRSENGGEAQSVKEWQDTAGSTDLIWGGFAQVGGGLMFGPSEEPPRYLIQAFARWETNESLSGQVGPSNFELDLDAFSAGAMAGFFF